METRRIGSLEVTVVGLGCNNFGGRIDEAATGKVVQACLETGINFFDTADVYGGTKSEEFLGRALGNGLAAEKADLCGDEIIGVRRLHVLLTRLFVADRDRRGIGFIA